MSSNSSCGVRVDGSLVCWGDAVGELPTGEFTAVSIGEGFGCALGVDASLACWGYEEHAESGLLDPPVGEFIGVSALHWDSVCAVRVDGSLVCWGDGRLGLLDAPAGEFAEVVTGLRPCGLTVGGLLVCWGDPANYGLLRAPQGDFQSVSSTSGYACAVRDSGELVCWDGYPPGGEGQPEGEFTQVSAAGPGMCALRADGDAVCWGTGHAWLDTERAGPFTQVSASNGVVCALRATGEVECWGKRSMRNFHDGVNTVTRFGDWDVPPGRFTQVAAYSGDYGGDYACGTRADTTLACWDLGTPDNPFALAGTPPALPAQDPQHSAAPALGAGFAASAQWLLKGTVSLRWDDVSGSTGYELMWYSQDGWVLLSDRETVGGAVMDFDVGNIGPLQHGGESSALVAGLPRDLGGYWFAVRARNEHGTSQWSASFSVEVPGSAVESDEHWAKMPPIDWLVDGLPADAGFASVAAARARACALRIDKTIVCWGQNPIAPDGEFTQLSVADQSEVGPTGQGRFCGLRTDATVTCWPEFYGVWNRPGDWTRLGDGRCGLRAGGQVECWGQRYGDEPLQGAGPLAGAAMGPHGSFAPAGACGIRLADSTLACWAAGVPADAPQGAFSDVSASARNGFCAVAADGSLACWDRPSGYNDEFRPLLYPPAGQFNEVSVGHHHACAIRADGTVACWGDDGVQVTEVDMVTE